MKINCDKINDGFRLEPVIKYAKWAAVLILTAGAAVSTIIILTVSATLLPKVALICSAVALALLLGHYIRQKVTPYLPLKLQNISYQIDALVDDLFILPVIQVLSPFKLSDKGSDSDQIPILLIHGYLHNNSVFRYMKYRLRVCGYRSIYTINLGLLPNKSLEEYCEQIQQKRDEILAKTGKDHIRYIGHSMGGLLAAQMATKNAHDFAISIQAPIRGTKLASLGLGPAASQMRQEAREADQLGDNIFYIGSKHDPIIRPYSSSINNQDPSDGNVKLFNGVGHAGALLSDEVMDCIISVLEKREHPVESEIS